jgi:hypothetical protein
MDKLKRVDEKRFSTFLLIRVSKLKKEIHRKGKIYNIFSNIL